MKGLFKFLAPFAPDYSGAVSVLFELGGLIVVYDAGGCTGNICGYDEPRWYGSKTALLSAGLRDMDAIFGRDDKLVEKIEDAVKSLPCSFIAIICTPAPAVIGTDFKALARAVHQRTGMPVITVGTNGMDLYDKGQDKAYMSLFEAFTPDDGKGPYSDIGILGATPLDMPNLESGEFLTDTLRSWGYSSACYGMGAGLAEIKKAGNTICNLVVSPSGFKAARWLKERFGAPYVAGFPLWGSCDSVLHEKITNAVDGMQKQESDITNNNNIKNKNINKRMLIINQQIMANSLREYMLSMELPFDITVATWFMLDDQNSEPGDAALKEEDDLRAIVKKHKYDMIIGDPLFKRAISDWQGLFLDMPHYAVSGRLYNNEDITELMSEIELYANKHGEQGS